MSLADALKAERELAPGPKCGMCVLLPTLDEEDRAELEASLAGKMSGSRISRAMRAVGINVSAQTILRHRRGDCSGSKSE